MPTVLTHAAVASGLAYEPSPSRRLMVTAMVLSILPDIDVIGFKYGVSYASDFGHRGITHSVAFAVLVSVFAAGALVRLGEPKPLRALLVLLAAAVSHPLLDMLTNGGLGCAIWAPFDNYRHFFPWRPIPVSPIGLGHTVVRVIGWEILLVWPWPLSAWVLRRPWPLGARVATAAILFGISAVAAWMRPFR